MGNAIAPSVTSAIGDHGIYHGSPDYLCGLTMDGKSTLPLSPTIEYMENEPWGAPWCTMDYSTGEVTVPWNKRTKHYPWASAYMAHKLVQSREWGQTVAKERRGRSFTDRKGVCGRTCPPPSLYFS